MLAKQGGVKRDLNLRLCQVLKPEDFFDHDDFVVDGAVEDLRINCVLLTLSHEVRVDR